MTDSTFRVRTCRGQAMRPVENVRHPLGAHASKPTRASSEQPFRISTLPVKPSATDLFCETLFHRHHEAAFTNRLRRRPDDTESWGALSIAGSRETAPCCARFCAVFAGNGLAAAKTGARSPLDFHTSASMSLDATDHSKTISSRLSERNLSDNVPNGQFFSGWQAQYVRRFSTPRIS